MPANEDKTIAVGALPKAGMGLRSKGRVLYGPQKFFFQFSKGIRRILANQPFHIN
jgi:hypothetical protein